MNIFYLFFMLFVNFKCSFLAAAQQHRMELSTKYKYRGLKIVAAVKILICWVYTYCSSGRRRV